MILISRKFEDSIQLAEIISSYGKSSFVEPLFETKFLKSGNDIKNFDVIIVTSKNAINSLKHMVEYVKNKPFIVVGDKTKNYLQALGVKKISTPGASVRDIVNYIIDKCDKSEKFYYPRGNYISLSIKEQLCSKGYEVIEEIVYRVSYKKTLSEELVSHINCGNITHAIFYSYKAFQCFLQSVSKYTKKAITELKIVVPFGCKAAKYTDNYIEFDPNDIHTVLHAIGITCSAKKE